MSEACVIYVRVSTDDQALGKSLEAQQQDCEQYARRMGWTILRIFSEPGESAKSAERPVFQEMVRFCQQRRHRVSRIVFWKISRYMRNIEDGFHFIRELKGVDCRIASATEPIPDGPEGKLLLTNLLLHADYENEVRSRQTRRVMEQLSLQGYWVHQAPYGFRVARDAAGFPVLVEHADTGPAIRHVFTSIAAGQMNSSEALAYLRAQGVKGCRASSAFSMRSLHDLLRKEIYCGRVRNSYTGGRAVAARFAGLVDEAIFDRAQARLSGRVEAAPRRRVRDDFPLRGFVECSGCGRPLTASWSKGRSGRYAYYACPSCAGHRIRKEDLERHYAELLDGITVRVSGRMAAFRALLLEEWQAVHGQAHQERDRARARVRQLNEKAERLLDKLLDGTIDDEAYRVRDQALKAELATAQVSAKTECGPTVDFAAVLQYADGLLRDLASTWLRLSGQARQWFQQGVFQGRLAWSPSEGLGTGVTNHLFSVLEALPGLRGGLAPPTGFEPVLPG
jgi:site-specific DNA recombinase